MSNCHCGRPLNHIRVDGGDACWPEDQVHDTVFMKLPGVFVRRYTCTTGHSAQIRTTEDGSALVSFADEWHGMPWEKFNKTCVDCELAAAGEPGIDDMIAELADAVQYRAENSADPELRERLLKQAQELRDDLRKKELN